MSEDVTHAQAHVWLELEHGCDQVLEFLSEESLWLVSAVSLPEKINSLLGDASVVGIIFFSR
jgi:hypothetical protein